MNSKLTAEGIMGAAMRMGAELSGGEFPIRVFLHKCARIQSFPESFVLDSVSEARQYKAIGNAVPPLMMWHIAKGFTKPEPFDLR